MLWKTVALDKYVREFSCQRLTLYRVYLFFKVLTQNVYNEANELLRTDPETYKTGGKYVCVSTKITGDSRDS